MSEQVAEIIELRRIRPVKWSTLDKKLGPYRTGYVKVFMAYEGSPLLDEDGKPIMSPTGKRQMEVTATSFAQQFGISPRTFAGWVLQARGVTAPWNQRFKEDTPRAIVAREDHGQCSHCPDWEGE